MTEQTRIPAKLAPFLKPKRFKVAKGGRGGGKSRGIGAMLLELGAAKPLRIACFREVQDSIKESVHQLLSDHIKRVGLEGFYRIGKAEIVGVNGTRFLFRGLSDITADNIKSLEGIDIAWCEEAQAISQRSLDLLIPTIRKPGSEIWFSMNPDLESDAVYKDFVLRERENCVVVTIGVEDNPWAPKELLDQRVDDYAVDPMKAAWVWGGSCRPIAEGAIYAREFTALEQSGRLCSIPYERSADTILAMDLGIGDHTSLVLGQWIGHERRVLHVYESSGVPLSHYVDHLKRLDYRIDRIVLPHDAEARELQTGRTRAEVMELAFPQAQVEIIPRTPDIETAINHVREHFGAVWIDRDAGILVEALKKYRRRKNEKTGLFEGPLHDTFSDMADAFRCWMHAETRRPTARTPRARQGFQSAW